MIPIQPLIEGQETRFLNLKSLVWSTVTTATANGSVNSMISSLAPLAGGISMINMMLGELIFGGVGVGMLSILMYAILTVFIAGLMVGRTPEYLSKKIEKNEIRWVMLAVLAPSALILIGAGVCILLPSVLNQSPTAAHTDFPKFSMPSPQQAPTMEALLQDWMPIRPF